MHAAALRGFSLAEMMISVALLGVLTVVLSVVVNGQMRVSTRTNERISLERNHLRLQETLRSDVVTANAVGLSLDAAGQRLACQPCAECD